MRPQQPRKTGTAHPAPASHDYHATFTSAAQQAAEALIRKNNPLAVSYRSRSVSSSKDSTRPAASLLLPVSAFNKAKIHNAPAVQGVVASKTSVVPSQRQQSTPGNSFAVPALLKPALELIFEHVHPRSPFQTDLTCQVEYRPAIRSERFGPVPIALKFCYRQGFTASLPYARFTFRFNPPDFLDKLLLQQVKRKSSEHVPGDQNSFVRFRTAATYETLNKIQGSPIVLILEPTVGREQGMYDDLPTCHLNEAAFIKEPRRDWTQAIKRRKAEISTVNWKERFAIPGSVLYAFMWLRCAPDQGTGFDVRRIQTVSFVYEDYESSMRGAPVFPASNLRTMDYTRDQVREYLQFASNVTQALPVPRKAEWIVLGAVLCWQSGINKNLDTSSDNGLRVLDSFGSTRAAYDPTQAVLSGGKKVW